MEPSLQRWNGLYCLEVTIQYTLEAFMKVSEVLNIALDRMKVWKKLFAKYVVHLCKQGKIIEWII